MPFASQREPVLWSGVCVALLGAAYCALLASPLQVDVPCPSSSCRLFQDAAIGGISLWWVGTAFFVLSALLCLRRWRVAAFGLAALALVLDCLLLVLMLVTAPCLPCLGAAVLIGVLFLVLRPQSQAWFNGSKRPSLLFLLWGGLFIAAACSAGAESLGRWTLYGPPEADRRVYFSPSCPACRDAIEAFGDSAAFVPVAETADDVIMIAAMQTAVADGKSIQDALAGLSQSRDNKLSMTGSLMLRLRLLRNKAEVLRLGFDKLPLLTINGMPQSLRVARSSSPTPPPASSGTAANSALPPELDPLGQCKEGPVPCPPAHD